MDDLLTILNVDVIERIFQFLEDEDLVQASQVNSIYYKLANLELGRRGKATYRWPLALPRADSQYLWVTETQGVKRVLLSCTEVKELHIMRENSKRLSRWKLRQVFKLCHNLQKLVLTNFNIEKKHIFDILDQSKPQLSLTLRFYQDISPKALQFIWSNKELFGEVLLVHGRKRAKGIFPNPWNKRTLEAPPVNILFCSGPGLENIIFSYLNLEKLIIEDATSLSDQILKNISDLPHLVYLGLSDFSCEETHWNKYFSNQRKFRSLRSLSLHLCSRLTNSMLCSISQKNLETLNLNLGTLQITNEALYFFKAVKFLTITTSYDVSVDVYFGISHYWTCLKSITVHEKTFGSTRKPKLNLNSIKRIAHLKKIRLRYKRDDNYKLGQSYFKNPFS